MKRVVEIIKELESTSGTNDKINIIAANADNELFKRTLKYTYADNMQYGFSEEKLRELLEAEDDDSFVFRGRVTCWIDVFAMLDELAQSNINDNLRKEVVNFLMMQSKDIRELFIRVITKDLRCNISAKTINKAIPKLITTWEVQQGHPQEKSKLKKNEWIALGLKLNGIRATYYQGVLRSRQNKDFVGYEDTIIHEINLLQDHFPNFVFDGELIRDNIDNLTDNENFRLTTSIVNSDSNDDKWRIKFVVFDMLPADEFVTGESKLTYKNRLEQLKQLEVVIERLGLSHLEVAPTYYTGTDHSQIEPLLEEIDSKGLEGLMLLRDVTYKCKRHSGILKCKKFKSADVRIVDFYTGKGKHEGKLGGFTVDFKGTHTNIGGGYTDEQREEMWANKESYIGKIMEIKYKEETMDKKTKKVNIQFGTFSCMRFDKTEPSYN